MAIVALSSCGGEEGSEVAEPSTTTVTTEPAPPPTIPSVSGPPPARPDVVGEWATVGEALQWRFTADGAFAFDRANLEAPATRGTWKLTGRTIGLVALGPTCLDDWEWRAGFQKGQRRQDDELEVVFVREGCNRIAGTKLTLVRMD